MKLGAKLMQVIVKVRDVVEAQAITECASALEAVLGADGSLEAFKVVSSNRCL